MRPRTLAFLLIAAVASVPLNAQWRTGEVFLDHTSRLTTEPAGTSSRHEAWLHTGHTYAFSTGGSFLLIKGVPFLTEGNVVIPRSDSIVFHHNRMVSFWDGRGVPYTDPAPAYSEIFRADVELGEIAPARTGRFFVPERSAALSRGAKLIEFDRGRRIAEHPFPELVDPSTGNAVGARHIELLDDQCTLLYTVGRDLAAGNRVLRMNLCTRESLSDFAALDPGQYAGAIRQLPNGDVLVANGDVLHFTRSGSLLRRYPFGGATHLALYSDGTGFWAAGVMNDQAILRGFDLAAQRWTDPVPLGNPGMQTMLVPVTVDDLLVVGEWRAGNPPPTTRQRSSRR